MDDSFEIPLIYKNEKLTFKSKLLIFGYSHKFEVEINNEKILFEPDEEGNYRAIIDPTKVLESKSIDKELLHQISIAITNILRSN